MTPKQAAAFLGSRGGKATGQRKARPSAHYSTISRNHWQAKRKRAFLITFFQLSPEAKSEQFAKHDLHGANQTALHLFVAIS